MSTLNDRPVSTPDRPIDVVEVVPTGNVHALRRGYCMGVCWFPGCSWMGQRRVIADDAYRDAEAHFTREHQLGETGP